MWPTGEGTGNEDFEGIAEMIERHPGGEKLPPNLDWPSPGCIKYLGLKETVHAAVCGQPRRAGRACHRAVENNRLIRPRSKYVGPSASRVCAAG